VDQLKKTEKDKKILKERKGKANIKLVWVNKS